MSIQKLVLAAATVAATASFASSASAQSYFGIGTTIDNSAIAELGLVRAQSDGVVAIYDNAAGTQGVLLGSKAVRAGANSDVRVILGSVPARGVIAVLEVNGQPVISKDYSIGR
tara:strand:- start:202 stop:543 length:342 start_codon:yes stop_codon:yes gene_type:complete